MSTARREAILAAFATRMSAARLPVRTDLTAGSTSSTLEDQGEASEERDYDMSVVTLTVRLEAVATAQTGESRATAENRLLAALISGATLGGTERTLSGLCAHIRYTGGGPVLEEDPTLYAGAWATFELIYECQAGNPYLPP